MSQIWMSDADQCDVRRPPVVQPEVRTWHDSFIRVIWRLRMRGMPRSHVWHDFFICVTWLIHSRHLVALPDVCTWLIHMCDMTHSHVWHDSYTCGTRLILCVHPWRYLMFARDSFRCVTCLIVYETWLIQMCDTDDCIWDMSNSYVTWHIHTYT